jgi:hypothetical protein
VAEWLKALKNIHHALYPQSFFYGHAVAGRRDWVIVQKRTRPITSVCPQLHFSTVSTVAGRSVWIIVTHDWLRVRVPSGIPVAQLAEQMSSASVCPQLHLSFVFGVSTGAQIFLLLMGSGESRKSRFKDRVDVLSA